MSIADPILILGASGWLGNYLVPEIVRRKPGVRVLAAHAARKTNFNLQSVESILLSSSHSSLLSSIGAGTVVNLARGEQEEDFQFHQSLIKYCNERGARYIYASSANAVDADVSKSHRETDPPASKSDYGRFKARCEIELINTCRNSLILRFAGVHGWAPNRIARTEEFLKKLADGVVVSVPPGILQNRIFVGDLAEMISILIEDNRVREVVHLGTSDFSDEIIFLRKLAEAFGYDQLQVSEAEPMEWNAVMIPERWLRIFPNLVLPTENETIRKVREQPEFQKYVRTLAL